MKKLNHVLFAKLLRINERIIKQLVLYFAYVLFLASVALTRIHAKASLILAIWGVLLMLLYFLNEGFSLWQRLKNKWLEHLDRELGKAAEDFRALQIAVQIQSDFLKELEPWWQALYLKRFTGGDVPKHRLLFEKEPIHGMRVLAEAKALTYEDEELTLVISFTEPLRSFAEKIARHFVESNRKAKKLEPKTVPVIVWLKPPPPEDPFRVMA
ncbi:MAG: hypothetical protein Q7R93_00125 [bacterium]|nr:hypothetical protein [bacterium]